MKKFTNDLYKEFLQVLGSIKDKVEDIEIQNGIISCKTNDNSILAYVDLKSIYPECLELPKAKEKFEILKMFAKSEEVTINVTTSTVILDTISKVSFTRPIVNLLNNRYMDPLNHDEIMSSNPQILQETISDDKISRLTTIAKTVGEVQAYLLFSKDSCEVKVRSSSKEYDTTVFKMDSVREDLSGQEVEIPLSLFDVAYDLKSKNSINFDAWKIEKGTDNILYMRVTGNLTPTIQGIFYARAKFRN